MLQPSPGPTDPSHGASPSCGPVGLGAVLLGWRCLWGGSCLLWRGRGLLMLVLLLLLLLLILQRRKSKPGMKPDECTPYLT